MAHKRRLNLIHLFTFLLVVLPFLFHLIPGQSFSKPPSKTSDRSTTQLSQLEPTIYGNSINSYPVNVPVPTINFLSNGGGSTPASFDEVYYPDHNAQSGINYFSFSGNPVFPHATGSPRLHLAFMIMRI